MWTAEYKNPRGEIQTKEFKSKTDLEFFLRELSVCGRTATVSFKH